ncbi:hypothetical protein KI387_044107 [Taxus chinensis]|uniref:Reverse transcriptase domain-containing protein n=1 Tax=Taxus chinensis TaxID=29808 RepID=A0AA38CNJ4_TAXCH|nr:hypothetical protein KI387_044107 [Taxus chinensis]
MLISPQGVRYYSAFRFQFACSNNTAEYEALVQGMHWAIKKKIKNLQVFGDSELIVNQVKGQHATKNYLLRCYKNRVWDLMEYFEGFGIKSIPRKENQVADRLAAVGAAFDIVESIQQDKQIIHFLQEEAEFSAKNQEKLEQQYGDQVVQLRTNKLPKGLITLESIFNPNDQLRKEKSNIQVKREDSVSILVEENKPLQIGKMTTDQERYEFVQLCQEFPDVFAWSYEDLKGFNPNLAQHTIELDPNTKPVRKKSGEIRLCVDFRDLNRVSLNEHYPLPSMEKILQVVAGSERFSLLDGCSGYNQIMVKEEDQFKTAFTTKWGTFAYRKMPFGLSNTGATFQRAMDMAFKGLINNVVLIYLDDITVFSKNAADHLSHLRQVFMRCRRFGVSLNPRKCIFLTHEGKLLGHIVSKEGLAIDPERVEAIRALPLPSHKKALQSFLGRINFVQKFVLDFAALVKPITKMLKKSMAFKWTAEGKESFEAIKEAIS